ncbi:MAG: TonB-dependent receptor [Gammaproteobacteria bacterium]|nr:TonB-dependent receptor [Gammaproteobacteria bacterium]
MTISRATAALLAASVLTALAAQAASEPLQEIVVTADFRGDGLSRIPASVTVLDADTLRDAGLQHFEDVMALVPNINFSGESSRPRYLQLRGIGERSQYQGAPNPSVGFIVDDIDFSGIGMVATLFDVDQFEVLRGPQGTRYGANALAGLVYVKSREPGDQFELDSEVTLGQDNARAAGLAFGGPIDEAWSYRLAAHQWRSDGFRDNVFLGRSDTNRRDELTTRGKLRYAPHERFTMDLTALWIDLDNGYDAFAIDNSLVTQSDRPGRDAQRSRAGSLRLEWLAGDAMRVQSISAAAHSDIETSFDGDWGNDEFWGEFAPYDFFSRTDRRRRTVSQELRVLSEPGAGMFDDRVAWLTGVYASSLNEDNDNLDLFNGEIFRELTSDYRARNLAVFGEIDITVADRLALKTGLRVERRRADYADSQGVAFDPSETMLGGAATLSWQTSDEVALYAAVSRGYKAGGFNIGLNIPDERREFDTEYLWNFETGLKGRFLDGALVSNLSVFYMLRREQQVSTSFQIDPTDPLTFVFFTDNAARGYNYGAELDLNWQFARDWSLFTSLGLLETKYREFAGGPVDRAQAHAPNYQFASGVSFRHPQGWFARVEVTGRDAFYFSDSHDQRSRPYELFNARLGWENERWQIALWGRNLLDRDYAVRGFFFGNEPPDFADTLYVRRGDPRQVGATLRYGF